MTYCPHEEEYKGYTIRILHDESPPNPRKEQDNLGTFITWERGHISPDSRDFPDIYDFRDWYDEHPAIALGVFRPHENEYRAVEYDHTRDDYEGVIYLPADVAIDEWPVAEAYDSAIRYLKAEVEEYSHWATGNYWGYQVLRDSDDSDTVLDSCWGFMGDYDRAYGALAEARAAVDYLAKEDAA